MSNDKPYAELIFLIRKYRPNYPSKGYATIAAAPELGAEVCLLVQLGAQAQRLEFRHAGVAPEEVMDRRKSVYEAARMANPNRW